MYSKVLRKKDNEEKYWTNTQTIEKGGYTVSTYKPFYEGLFYIQTNNGDCPGQRGVIYFNTGYYVFLVYLVCVRLYFP